MTATPKSAARTRGGRKAIRDLLQAAIAVVAAGGTTALIDLILGSVNPVIAVPLGVFFKILVTYAQNYLETAGKIPVILPTPGLVPSVGGVVAPTVGTVETVVEKAGDAVGEVTGVVQDVAGGLLGEVVDVDKMPDEDH